MCDHGPAEVGEEGACLDLVAERFHAGPVVDAFELLVGRDVTLGPPAVTRIGQCLTPLIVVLQRQMAAEYRCAVVVAVVGVLRDSSFE